MREWRKQIARAGLTLTPEKEAAYMREELLFLEAARIFGNDDDANAWCLRVTSAQPPFEHPRKIASESPDGLQRALALLASVAPVVERRPARRLAAMRPRRPKAAGPLG